VIGTRQTKSGSSTMPAESGCASAAQDSIGFPSISSLRTYKRGVMVKEYEAKALGEFPLAVGEEVVVLDSSVTGCLLVRMPDDNRTEMVPNSFIKLTGTTRTRPSSLISVCTGLSPVGPVKVRDAQSDTVAHHQDCAGYAGTHSLETEFLEYKSGVFMIVQDSVRWVENSVILTLSEHFLWIRKRKCGNEMTEKIELGLVTGILKSRKHQPAFELTYLGEADGYPTLLRKEMTITCQARIEERVDAWIKCVRDAVEYYMAKARRRATPGMRLLGF